ncbi:MAG: hypothetical protein ACR2LC_10980 [Pyrinomonadaceae bacterium]
MAHTDSRRLDHGDRFPHLELQLTDDTTLALPSAAKNGWLVFLVYRGHW